MASKLNRFSLTVVCIDDRSTRYVSPDLRWAVAGRTTKLFIFTLFNKLPLIPYEFRVLYSMTLMAFTTLLSVIYTLFLSTSNAFMIPLIRTLIYTLSSILMIQGVLISIEKYGILKIPNIVVLGTSGDFTMVLLCTILSLNKFKINSVQSFDKFEKLPESKRSVYSNSDGCIRHPS